MANINEELASAMEAAQREFESLGKITDATAARLKVAQTAVDQFKEKMNLAANASSALYKTFSTYNRAVYDGIKSYKDLASTTDALADSIEAVSAALALFLPIGRVAKIVVAGLGLLAGELTRSSKIVGEQLSNIRTGFEGLAEYGATASRGMSEVFEGLQRLGLSVAEADHMVKLMASNADVVTLFGRTMADSQRQFENTVEGMRGFRGDLLSLGVPIKEQTTVAMNYLKLQKQLTMGTKEQMDTSGAAVAKYVKEVDLLTRITGLNRDEQQKTLDRAMKQATYAAARDELAENNLNAAKLMDDFLTLAKSVNEEMEDAVVGMAGGYLANEAAVKGFTSSQGKLFEVSQNIRSGEIKDRAQLVESMREALRATGEFGKTMRGTYALGAMEKDYFRYQTTRLSREKSLTMSAENLNKAQGEQTDLLEGLDPVTKRYQQDLIRFHDQMLKSQKDIQAMVPAYQATMGGVTSGLDTLRNAAVAAAGALYRLANPTVNSAPTASEMSGAATSSKSAGTNLAQTHADVMGGKFKGEVGGGVGRIEQAEQQRKIELDKALELQKRSGYMSGSVGGSIFSSGGSDSSVSKYIDFGSNSGDRAHFDQLSSGTKSAFIAMAADYYSMTKTKLRITSAARSREEQQKLYDDWVARGKTGYPVAEPGTSKHEMGNALDLDSSQISALAAKGLLSQYGFKTLAGDPVHIFMRNGGVIPATPGGTMVTAGEAGNAEAFVPLKDGAIPVSFSDSGMDKVVEAITETQNQNNSMMHLVEQLLSAQKINNDLTDRLLRLAQN